MNIVAQMMIRNEADVIVGTLDNLRRWGVNCVCILDGESTDRTPERILDFGDNHPDMDIFLLVKPDEGNLFSDDRRNALLAMCRPYEPDWIISVDADERYHTSPVEAIEVSDKAGANYVRCVVPQFWMTFYDLRHGLELEPEDATDIEERRLWYSWGHTGVFIWKWNEGHYYPTGEQKRTPECDPPDVRTYGPVYPICKHYCFRTLPQAVRRRQERQVRGGIEYFGKYFEASMLIDEQEASLHHFDGDWAAVDNHKRLYEYWGNVRSRYSAEYSGAGYNGAEHTP